MIVEGLDIASYCYMCINGNVFHLERGFWERFQLSLLILQDSCVFVAADVKDEKHIVLQAL